LRKNTLKDYFLLYFSFFIFSCCAIFSKLASKYPAFSTDFFFFWGLGLLVMAIYALLWQRVLKRFKLFIAYANRQVVTVLGMLWGVLLFREEVTWNMILGSLVIFTGIGIVMIGERK